MPIPLGVLAVAGAGGAVAGNAYEWLETVSVGTAVASISFSSLNATYGGTYQHLQIRAVMSHTEAGGNALRMQMNGDTGSNYANHELGGNGSSVFSNGNASQASILNVGALRQNISNNSFGATIIDILDPFEATKNPTVRSLNGHASTESIVTLSSGFRNNTAAITSITLFMASGNINAKSRFSLYGLRSA